MVRWGWWLPLIALALLLGSTYYLDRQTRGELDARRRAAASEAEREASVLAEAIGAEVAGRIGALAAAKLQFTQVEDSLSERTFLEAVDSVIGGLPGMAAVSVVYPGGRIVSSRTAALPREFTAGSSPVSTDPTTTALAAAYARALATRRPTATPVLELRGARRVVVFDPVAPSDTAPIQAVLAGELEPLLLLRAALRQERRQVRPAFYDLYDPEGARITTVGAPEGWPSVRRPVYVADTEWRLYVAYQPVRERAFAAVSLAIRVFGVLLALGFGLSLFLLWRMVVAQQRELKLRQEAEARAQAVNEQLKLAQETSLRLSGSIDPDQVIDEFLGAVGVEVGAEVGRLYGFEESGDVLVGRRMVVLSATPPEEGVGRPEEFQKVRLRAQMMPHLAEPVATGEPYLSNGDRGAAAGQEGLTGPSATLTVPLAIAGKLVALAAWESHRPGRRFAPGVVPFAQAVSAHAAAALRAAELMEGVRQAREKAHREAVRLATVLEQLSDGVVLFDREGLPERVNAAAEALLGPALADTPLQDWPEVFRISDGRTAPGEFAPARALEGRAVRDARLTVRRPGGERYVAVSAAPIRGADDSVRGAALVLRDVTAEHEYAEMLRHTNRELRDQATLLEQANDDLRAATAAKDQFLAMMSHELRTPINAVIGYAEIMTIGVHGELNERQRWMLSRVSDTSRHLLGLIEDVLDLAKIGAGRINLSIGEVALDPLIERAATQIMPLAAEKELALRKEGAQGLRVLADEMRLLQILINLCSNAVKFTDRGSISIGSRAEDADALITVRDTGPGIEPAQLETVFEEFHQLDSGLARKEGGSGLGLTISRRLARLMGGDVTVRSVVGAGTEFTVRVPLAPERKATGEGSEPEAEGDRERRG